MREGTKLKALIAGFGSLFLTVCIVGSLYGRDIVAPRADEDINFITKPGGVSTIALVIKGDTGIVDGDISGNAGTVTNGVYTTGAQTIGGNKTFTGASVFEKVLK